MGERGYDDMMYLYSGISIDRFSLGILQQISQDLSRPLSFILTMASFDTDIEL